MNGCSSVEREKMAREGLGKQIEHDLVASHPSLARIFTNSEPSTPRPRLILVTGHRRENFGEGFDNICHALAEIADKYDNIEIVYPVHLKPNVQEPVQRILRKVKRRNVHLIEPVEPENDISCLVNTVFAKRDCTEFDFSRYHRIYDNLLLKSGNDCMINRFFS